MKQTLSLAFVSALFSSSAMAHSCVGKVTGVSISGSADLQLNIDTIGTGNLVCNMRTQLGEMTPEACNAAMSVALAAQMSNKKVRLYFRNDTNTDCAKGSWKRLTDTAHNVYFLGVEN